MKKQIRHFPAICWKVLPVLICLLLLIYVLKELSLYDRLLALYDSLIPIFSGLVIAFLLQPIIDRLANHCSDKSAVMIVYAGILLGGGLLLVILLPILYQQIMDFALVVPDWITKIENFLSQRNIVFENLHQYKDTFMQEGYTIVVDSVRSFMATATKYGIGYITAFFISIDLAFWRRTARKIINNYHRFATFYKTMSNIVYQYLVGTLLDLGFVALTSWVILYAANFPNALLYAIVLALSNLFPYIGPTVGLLIVLVVGMLSYDQLPVLSFILIWVIQQIEANFVQPLIFNKTMDVRPILTFISLFISEALFGIPGVLLSPIFASIMQIAFRSYVHAKTNTKVGEWEDIWHDFDEAIKQEELYQDKDGTSSSS